MFFLFGILTMDDWYYHYNEFYVTAFVNHSTMLGYLLIYLFLNWLIMINLFVAVLVDNFTLALQQEEKEIGPIEDDEEDDPNVAEEESEDEWADDDQRMNFEEYYSAK